MKGRDENCIWHPYTQHGASPEILPVRRARGAYLELDGGQEVLDAISSWWVNIHGHGHPEIVSAIEKQATNLDHVIFAGFTHESAVKLAETLLQASRKSQMDFERVFYSDNGSTAVEVALKMAYQYHQNIGNASRTKFIALKDAYHGDTTLAMAVGEPEGFHAVFRKLFPKVDFVSANDLPALERLVGNEPDAYAAFIFEPILQGASGMKLYSPEYLRDAVNLCKKHGIVTIADEVFTGFYRTGKFLASEHAGVSPDLLCLSKGITGGTLPLAVTLANSAIFQAFAGSQIRDAFLHGHSYTANPIACAAALASWKLLESAHCQKQIQMISASTAKNIARFENHALVKNARFIGTIGALELKSDRTYFSKPSQGVTARALARGVLLRPLGNVIYAVPPYCVTELEVNQIYSVMEEIVHEFQ